MSLFGQVLREYRTDAQLTLKDVAEVVLKDDGEPMSLAYLSDIERGKRAAPSDSMIVNLADAVGVDSDLFFIAAGRIPPDVRMVAAAEFLTMRHCFERYRHRIKEGEYPRELK